MYMLKDITKKNRFSLPAFLQIDGTYYSFLKYNDFESFV